MEKYIYIKLELRPIYQSGFSRQTFNSVWQQETSDKIDISLKLSDKQTEWERVIVAQLR